MSTLTRSSLIVMSVALAATAFAEEQTDSSAEQDLLDTSSAATEEEAPPQQENIGTAESDRAPTEEEVLAEYARFISLLEDQNYDAADVAAKRVIEMSIRIYGPQSHETAKALNNLGVVQNNSQQYEAAVQNFTSAIEILEALEDRLNSELINPLKGLGAAQLGAGRPDLARNAYSRAKHITHVNEGPHNVEQVEILEALAEAYVRMGDVEAARDTLDRIHFLNVRHFSDDAMGLLPSLMRRASWQHNAGYYNDERATYRRAIRIIEDSAGNDDPRLVEPLVRLGKSFYFFEPIPQTSPRYGGSSGGEAYLKRANRIAEHTPGFPWLDLATTKLALAEYYLYVDSYSRADRIFEEVWNDLSASDENLEMRDDLLGQPQPLWSATLPPYTNNAAGAKQRREATDKGLVTVIYTVSNRGRTNISEVRTEPQEFTDIQKMVEREVRRRIYRPVISDGEAVDSEPQIFTHEFAYTLAELEAMRAPQGEAEQTAAKEE